MQRSARAGSIRRLRQAELGTYFIGYAHTLDVTAYVLGNMVIATALGCPPARRSLALARPAVGRGLLDDQVQRGMHP
ncbi:hypothetical protein ACGFSB_21955 [Streptomyces sp. NPDC048441]|uniref:hypothetical protein n=1 Tax=Streptomyces sp. NPDC048441 TaxID=3365552 RepID=UPI00371D931E